MSLAARLLAAVVLTLVLAAAPATASTPSVKLYACVTKSYKTLNLTSKAANCPKGETKVSWNVEGPQGPKGSRGAAGTKGAKGEKGEKGEKGDAGAKGEAGARGDKGDAGVTGETGATGTPGAKGDTGATGPSGTPADLSAYQQRVTGVCASGTFLQSIAVDGTVGCTTPTPTLPLTLTTADAATPGISVALTNPGNAGRAISAKSALGIAVYAESAASNPIQGLAHAINTAAVVGDNARGEVVVGRGGAGCDDGATNCNGIGAVVGRNDGPGGYGVRGFTTANGSTYKGIGVLGQSGISGGNGAAVRAENVNAANTGNTLEAVTNAAAGTGLYVQAPSKAAVFNGSVTINGDLTVSGTKSGFHIDDPRAPTARTLTHTPLETDALMVQYTGNVRTDAHGRATVKLPSYAETLAGDWRYQLTPIGAFGQAIVAREVRDGAFVVRTQRPRTKVSWTVTGVRHDPQAKADAIVPVKAKTGAGRGRYLDPQAYGKPSSDGVPGITPVGAAGLTTARAASRTARGLPSSR